MSYKKLFDNFTWSYSRVHCYENCPYQFYKKYIEMEDGESNFYADNGKIMHSVFEKLLKGEICLSEAPNIYYEEFSYITNMTNRSIMDNTFNKCNDYLCAVQEFDENNYEILGVEDKFNFNIDKYKFVGYADCIIKNKQTGDTILVDHKSINHMLKKDGTVLKNMEEKYVSYQRQMYTYAKGMYDKYGIFPDKMILHHFKDNGVMTEIKFDIKQYNDTMKYITNVIKKIYKDNVFSDNQSFMFCNSLCNYRNSCEYKNS